MSKKKSKKPKLELKKLIKSAPFWGIVGGVVLFGGVLALVVATSSKLNLEEIEAETTSLLEESAEIDSEIEKLKEEAESTDDESKKAEIEQKVSELTTRKETVEKKIQENKNKTEPKDPSTSSNSSSNSTSESASSENNSPENKPEEPTPEICRASLSAGSVTVEKNLTTTVHLTLSCPAPYYRIIFVRSDESIAGFSWSGESLNDTDIQITGRNVGTTTVYIEDLDHPDLISDSLTVNVTPETHVTGISLDRSHLDLKISHVVDILATISPENAQNKRITWTSSNESVATVHSIAYSATGSVVGVGEGDAVITARTEDGGFIASLTVHVEKIPVERIELVNNNGDWNYYSSHGPYRLGYRIYPYEATNQGAVWKSSDESVITITQDGYFTCKRRGNSVVTITSLEGGFVDYENLYCVE